MRTVYDGLNRPGSTWVGTNDVTGGGQEWSITNQGTANLIDVADYFYDGTIPNGQPQPNSSQAEAIGDSLLTEEIDHRHSGSVSAIMTILRTPPGRWGRSIRGFSRGCTRRGRGMTPPTG